MSIRTIIGRLVARPHTFTRPRGAGPSTPVKVDLARGLVPAGGRRLPIPFATPEQTAAWRAHFFRQMDKGPQILDLHDIYGSERPLLSSGLRGGAPGEIGMEGLHYPLGYDRAYVIGVNGFTMVTKGGGQREARRLTPFMEGSMRALPENSRAQPIAMSPMWDTPEGVGRPLIGGGGEKDFHREVRATLELLRRAHEIDGRLDGIPFPLGMHLVEDFPVRNETGSWKNVPGWDYFTNPAYQSPDQLLNVGELVRGNSRDEAARAGADKFIAVWKNANDEQSLPQVEDALRLQVGRAFMEALKPATYTYAISDTFRIGHLYAQLVTNEFGALRNLLLEEGYIRPEDAYDHNGLPRIRPQPKDIYPLGFSVDEEAGMAGVDSRVIQTAIDEQLVRLYGKFGLQVEPPYSTRSNLHTYSGRLTYLREFGAKNSVAARALSEKFATEIGRQLGIIHGSGGHAGGHIYFHRLGAVTIHLEKEKDHKAIRIDSWGEVYTISSDGSARQLTSEEKIDLTGYIVTRITAEKDGDIYIGARGGGSTRPDNLGFGLRDLNHVTFDPFDEEGGATTTGLDTISTGYSYAWSKHFTGVEVEDMMQYFHIKLIQHADMDMLVACCNSWDTEFFPGAFPQLALVLGGDLPLMDHLSQTFLESYQKYYAEAQRRFAPEEYREQERDGSRTVELEIPYSSRDPRSRKFIESLFPRTLSRRVAV